FFSEMLAHIDTPTAPFGIMHANSSGEDVAEAHLRICPDLAARMRAAAARAAVPPATLAHLAWALVLSRLCGQDEVVFGTVLFGRLQGGLDVERAMGLFINTLPLAVNLRNQTAAQVLTQIAKRLVSLIRHEHAPLSVAKSCAGIPAGGELFTAMLNYRHSAAPAQDGSENAFAPGITILSARERTNYPFAMSVDDLGIGFALTAQSVEIEGIGWTAQALCDLMREALAQLTTAVEQESTRPALALSLLAENDLMRLEPWTGSPATLSDPRPLMHQRFEEHVALHPDATAIVFEDQNLTYGTLDARANRLARHLIGLGMGPDERVALVMERGFDLIVAILATLKAGGAYVPLDPAWPTERLTYAIKDSRAKVVLTHEAVYKTALSGTHPDTHISDGPQIVCMDAPQTRRAVAHRTHTRPGTSALSPQSLAYVIYTSGSTGRP
ncbi:MAG: non-ribosomal peptide synthetase, partial [Proteobacteria bacterium]|nr:non-ribosomal peptide synthetase [Pseudomonadota bacterium]